MGCRSVTFPKRFRRFERSISASSNRCLEGKRFTCGKGPQDGIRKSRFVAFAFVSSILLHIWDYADVWFRDYGPTFVVTDNATKRRLYSGSSTPGVAVRIAVEDRRSLLISERLGLPPSGLACDGRWRNR